MPKNFVNKINTNLDNYYVNPYRYKFINKVNLNDDYIIDKTDDIDTIIQTLTSIIMSNKSIKTNTDYLTNNDEINLESDISDDLKLNKTQNKIQNQTPSQILFKLIANNNITQLKSILKNNYININIQDEDGDTPLHISVFLSNYKACEILLLNNASINLKDKWGQIPIHRICFSTQEEEMIKIINLFDKYQIKLNLKSNIFNYVDNLGNTPLHLVLNYFIKNDTKINNNQLKIIKKLKSLTDIKIKNKDNCTIIDLLNILNL